MSDSAKAPEPFSTDLALVDMLLDSDSESWYSHWLQYLRHTFPYTAAVVLVRASTTESLSVAAFETVVEAQAKLSDQLQSAAQHCLDTNEPVVAPLSGAHYVAAWPLLIEGECLAVVALVLTITEQKQLENYLTLLEWNAGWLQQKMLKAKVSENANRLVQQTSMLQGYATIFNHAGFAEASLALCDYLCRELDCERVVLGYIKNGTIDICCQSDSSEYVERLGTMKLCAKAMIEAQEQLECIYWPLDETEPTGTNVQVNHAHKTLCDYMNQSAALSVPLLDKEFCYGVVLFERLSHQPFSSVERIQAESLANVLGLALEQKRQAQQSFTQLILNAAKAKAETIVAPGYLGRKISLISIALLFLFFCFARGEYHLSADAVLEGAEIRAVSAPFDGFLDRAPVRAGDTIAKGALVVGLDTRELRLQRIQLSSEVAQVRRQYEDALARQDRAQVQVLNAQIKRTEAELNLVKFQLQQAEINSPFDAIVVSGDQSQRIGAAVRQGDVLFELAPNNEFRIVLLVNEFRINDIKLGQQGFLVLAAVPDKSIAFTVNQITLIAEPYEGESVYRVEAELTQSLAGLRPGLEGVAKVHVDERLLIDIWTRSFRDWLRLQWWRVWG